MPIWTGVGLLLVIWLLARPASAEIIDRVLAVVDGRIVTLSDVRGAIDLGIVQIQGAADPTAAALSQLIDRELILAEVQRYLPAEPEPAATARKVEAARARFKPAAAFEAALAVSGLDTARVHDIMRDELRIQTYLSERFASGEQIHDAEIATYLREHREEPGLDGRSIQEARDLARQRLTAERRTTQIAEWLAGLRRRADVTELYLPGAAR